LADVTTRVQAKIAIAVEYYIHWYCLHFRELLLHNCCYSIDEFPTANLEN